MIGVRSKNIEANNPDADLDVDMSDEDKKILTLEPLDADDIPLHDSVLINELKLSDFKQVLMKNNISSEFSGGILWCNNGSLALRRVDPGRVTIEGNLSEEYYKIRDLLYEQYAII